MNQSNIKSCLLIIPINFYSYEKHIREALIDKGFQVKVSNDEFPVNTLGKIMGKLHIPILLFITNLYISKRFLNDRKYDLVLIFKGRGISSSLIEKIKKSSDKIIGYTWDSFKHTKAPLRWYRQITKFHTPEYRDADNFSIPILELYSSQPTSKEGPPKKYEISAILKNYPGRLKYLDKVIETLGVFRNYIYIYEQNIFFGLINFLRAPSLFWKYRMHIFFKPLPYEEYLRIVGLSEFTIDYAHHNQSSVSMRCFEIIGNNTRIISNNPFLKRSKYFNNSNSIFFDGKKTEELLDSYNICKTKKSIFEKRSISEFIDELIG